MNAAATRHDPARQLVCNLARRLRMARRVYARARQLPRVTATPEGLQHLAQQDGAQLEAWNSFQAAKQLLGTCPR